MQKLDIPDEGLIVWLRNFGQVKLFRMRLKDELRHYVTYLPNADDYGSFKKTAFQSLHDQHWKIEQYHRMIKQVCNIERFQVRTKVAILNHIFASLCSFVHLQKMTLTDLISNAYQWKRELFNPIIEKFIRGFTPGKSHLEPQFNRAVNA